MQNYHRHDSYSNIHTPFKDSAMVYEDYAKRAVELGQSVLSCVNHGFQGNYLRCWQMAKKYRLKFVYGVEAYWVADRKAEYEDGVDKKTGEMKYRRDKANAHIVVLAQNYSGILQINEMLSTANEDGFYGVPRIDLELLLKLNPNDVFITTACVAFWGKVNKETQRVKWHYGEEENTNSFIVNECFGKMLDHFGDSMYLEVQCHNTVWQREINRLCLDLHYKHGVPLIAGMDSHYIYPHQKEERKWLREESGVHMNDEDHEFADEVYEDYPDEETFKERFRKQGVLTEDEILEAVDNTNLLLYFDDIEFDVSRKLPTIYPNLTQEERNQKYLDTVWAAWDKYKQNVPPDLWKTYEDSFIKEEVNMVVETNMSDYFLLDHEMVKLGVQKGGMITPSGRGSSGSWFTNTLLGMSTLDRFDLPVPLYPARFCTADRLKTSCPDLDLNLDNPAIFAEAQDELLTKAHGSKGHSYPMIAYGTLKHKSAFKLFARAQELPADEANEVSRQIDTYEKAYANADEDDKDMVVIEDYVDKKYLHYVEDSAPYRGIVVSKSQAPCAYMIYNGDIRSEVGIMRVNADGGKKVVYCTVTDGYTSEEFGYVKNDCLRVAVIGINGEAMRRAGLPQYTSKEIIELTKNDPATWDILAKGWTQGINQCQGTGTTEKLVTYKPRSLQDLSAFVAAIRPGFKSMAPKFLHREKFEYGIPSFDALLKNDTTGSSWLLYQEDIMKCLALAGFSMAESYPLIKAISKKKAKVIDAAKIRFIDNFKTHVMESDSMTKEEALEVSNKVWQIIIDSSKYSFNACVSGSTKLYRGCSSKYEPTVEEMYKIKNDLAYAKQTEHIHLHAKYLRTYGFGYSMFDDGRIRPNRIIDIREAGVQKTYRVKTEFGAEIVCTENHRFPTPNGKLRLDELNVGDLLYVKGKYEKCTNRYVFTDGSFDSNVPQKGQKGFQKNHEGNSVKYYAFRDLCVVSHLPCNCCGKEYHEGTRFEVHHRDMDRCNNEFDNFDWLCVSCHKKAHYRNGRKKKGEKGYPTLTSPIVSIEFIRKEMTYDIEMADPAHNFVTDTGLVTCNSHAVAVAIDALYGAYLKAHYPFEYYSTLLDSYANQGNKEKVALIKDEMKKTFGIQVVPCRFRQDNRSFYVDKERKQVADALHSVKCIGKSVPKELYGMRDMQFDSFVDLLCALDDSKVIKSNVILILIKMGYFEEFGSKGKLLAVYKEFDSGKNKITKQLKDATREKRLKLLREFESQCPESDLSPEEQIAFEAEHYGSPISVFKEARGKFIVLELETKYSPKAKCYSIGTGNTGVFKILKKDFTAMPFEAGDIITVLHAKEKLAMSYVDGKRVPKKGVYENWVDLYEVTRMPKKKREANSDG